MNFREQCHYYQGRSQPWPVCRSPVTAQHNNSNEVPECIDTHSDDVDYVRQARLNTPPTPGSES